MEKDIKNLQILFELDWSTKQLVISSNIDDGISHTYIEPMDSAEELCEYADKYVTRIYNEYMDYINQMKNLEEETE